MRVAVILSVLALLILYACKRSIVDVQENNVFNATLAKEWYYGVFKKTDEYKNSKVKNNQLPDWKNGLYYKNGDLEIVEFPLYKNEKKVLIEKKGKLSTAEIGRLVAATSNKIAFIKDKLGNIMVREIDYIPDWDYLKQNGYDISDYYYSKPNTSFTGKMYAKHWGGKIISYHKIINGSSSLRKPENKVSPFGNQVATQSEDCPNIIVQTWKITCVFELHGDVWVNSGECDEPELVDEQEYPDPNCGNGGDPEECEMYGTCPPNNGSGGTEPPTDCSNSQAEAMAIVQSEFDKLNNIQVENNSETVDDIEDENSLNENLGQVFKDAIVTWTIAKDGTGNKIIAKTHWLITWDSPNFATTNNKNKTMTLTHMESKYVGTNHFCITTWHQDSHLEVISNNNTRKPSGRAYVSGSLTVTAKAKVKITTRNNCEIEFNPGLENTQDVSSFIDFRVL